MIKAEGKKRQKAEGRRPENQDESHTHNIHAHIQYPGRFI
jgi:hypothetical protein